MTASKQVDSCCRRALCLLPRLRARENDGCTTQTALCAMASDSYGPRPRDEPLFLDVPMHDPGQDRKRTRRDDHDSKGVFERRAESEEKAKKDTVRRSRYPLYQNIHHAVTLGVVHRLCNDHTVPFCETDQHTVKLIAGRDSEEAPTEEVHTDEEVWMADAHTKLRRCAQGCDETPLVSSFCYFVRSLVHVLLACMSKNMDLSADGVHGNVQEGNAVRNPSLSRCKHDDTRQHEYGCTHYRFAVQD